MVLSDVNAAEILWKRRKLCILKIVASCLSDGIPCKGAVG
jgi:hypothetical protein